MITVFLAMLFAGIAMSAFFSGSETGFYRASRTRLVLDAMEGQGVSRRLLFLVNHPTLFVATALVGNNVANYLASLAIVLVTRELVGPSFATEMAASLIVAPFIFVYGELLPKNLFYQAPNALLRRSGQLFTAFSILFAPLSAVLWLLGQVVEKLIGQSPVKVRLALAKKELGDVLLEGQHAGILHPTQLEMTQGFFDVATRPVTDWMELLDDIDLIDDSWSRDDALKRIRDLGQNRAAVGNPRSKLPTGYVSAVELCISQNVSGLSGLIQPLVELRSDCLHGEAILTLQANHSEMAGVVDDKGQLIGLISREALLGPLLSGTLESLLDNHA
jgi:CBS domain containing-hemolysin-like protein